MVLMKTKLYFVFCCLLIINDSRINSFQIYPEIQMDKSEFINNFWLILHSFAASYPNDPCKLKKDSFANLLLSFNYLLPDQEFKDQYFAILQTYNLEFGNREEAVKSICEMHNEYNKLKDLPLIDCSKAFEFWGGGCGCSDSKNEENEKEEAITNLN